jgi:hypothetical protein
MTYDSTDSFAPNRVTRIESASRVKRNVMDRCFLSWRWIENRTGLFSKGNRLSEIHVKASLVNALNNSLSSAEQW